MRVILPQITLITQRECSKLHYFAEKDRLIVSIVVGVLLFWVLSASSARSAGDNGVSSVYID